MAELKLKISTDASSVQESYKATQANINKLLKQMPQLSEAYKQSLDVADFSKIQKQFDKVIALINRGTTAVSNAHPEIDTLTAKYKFLTDSVDSLGREYKGFGTEAYEVLTNLQKETENLIETQSKLSPNMQNQAFAFASGSGEKNAMGNAYSSPETYEQMWERLLKDQDEAIAKQEKLTSAVASTGKATSSLSKLFSTTFNVLQFRVIMNVINSVARFKDFLADSTKVAAEAEQVFSKLNTVFGQTSNALSKASSLATKLGTATSTAASSLSTVGDLLQAQGMTTAQSLEVAYEWASTFQDIIAFKDINMSLEEFAQNFMSGAAGNLRNFRTFGSIVRESAVNAELAQKGLDKLSGAELELAKMTTRAEMALKQQKNAIGATEREWDTMLSINRRYEESLKSLKENTGETLEPITKWWVELKTSIVDAMNQQLKYNKLMGTLKGGSALEAIYPIYGEDGSFSTTNLARYYDDIKSMMTSTPGSQARANNLQVLAAQYGILDSPYLGIYARTGLKQAGYGGSVLEDIMKTLLDNVKALNYTIEKTTAQNTENTNITVFADSLVNAFEKMLSVNGISAPGTDVYKDFIKAYDAQDLNTLKKYTQGGDLYSELSKDFIKNLDKSIFAWIDNPATYATERKFGEKSDIDVLKEAQTSFRELYTILESAGGLFSSKDLQSVYGTWVYLGSEIEKLEALEQERLNKEKNGEAFRGAFGEFGDLFGFGTGDIYSTLLEILSQTEAFQEMSTILTDSILPILDAFLKPLLPVIEIFSDIIMTNISAAFSVLWPLIKIIATTLTYVAGCLDFVSKLIETSIKWLVGQLVKCIFDAIDLIPGVKNHTPSWARQWASLNPWDEANKAWSKMNQTLEDIDKLTFDIKENTEETDFETLRNLFLAKEISEDQYRRLTRQDRYSLGTVTNGVTYAQNTNRSFVSVNSLIVQAPDGMTLEEFLHNADTFVKGQAQYA